MTIRKLPISLSDLIFMNILFSNFSFAETGDKSGKRKLVITANRK